MAQQSHSLHVAQDKTICSATSCFGEIGLWPGTTSASGVRREKAALSSGCKSHPATAPAGSNRSSHGGNEVAEASG